MCITLCVCVVIAKRRIVLTATQITEAILNTDLDVLLPEHCDLLLKFIPTEEEVSKTQRLYPLALSSLCTAN